MKPLVISLLSTLIFGDFLVAGSLKDWQLGPFTRGESINPVIVPDPNTEFFCPIKKELVKWECAHTFNPAAVVYQNKVHILYRAEDGSGDGIGGHTSRLGLAMSDDGMRFEKNKEPVFYPDNDEQTLAEWPGGCEDPRIVQKEDGTFVMTYTQWAPKSEEQSERLGTYVLGIATSKNLREWTKQGYAFAKSTLGIHPSKSGSIVCVRVGDSLIATKIQGKYWMYWGDGPIYAATSEDLLNWEPVMDKNGRLLPALNKRRGNFDSDLVEAGPPAVLTEKGIVLLYNGRNSLLWGDPSIEPWAYSAGQVLFDVKNPLKALARTNHCFLKPEKDFEKVGQYAGGTVFVEGLVPFKGRWYLYYGTADSAIGVAVSDKL